MHNTKKDIRIIGFIVLSSFFLFAGNLQAYPISIEDIMEEYNRAQQLIGTQKLDPDPEIIRQANQIYEKILLMLEKIDSAQGVSYATMCLFLGDGLYAVKEYEEAKEKYEKAKTLFQLERKRVKTMEPFPLERRANLGIAMALSNIEIWEKEKINVHLKIAGASLNHDPTIPQQEYPEVLSDAAKVFLLFEWYDSARIYANEAHRLAKKNQDNKTRFQALNTLGIVFRRTEKYQQSIQSYKDAENYIDQQGFSFIKFHNNIGLAYLYGPEDYEKALEHCRISWSLLFPELDPDSLHLLPVEVPYPSTTKAITLKVKGTAFYLKYLDKGRLLDLKYAYEHFEMLSSVVDHLRMNLQSASDRRALSEVTERMWEQAIKVCYSYWQETGNDHFLHRAYAFSEQNKALLLREHFSDQSALVKLDTSKKEIEKELELERLIGSISESLGRKKSPSTWLQLREKLDSLENIRETMIQDRKTRYPAYFNLKYSNAITPVPEIQHRLAPDQAMISYLLGDKELFAFLITKDTFSIHWIPEFDTAMVVNFVRLLQNRKEYTVLENRQFRRLGFQLYKHLFQAMEPMLSTYNRLVIIPDGLLGYLPFEALLREEVPENVSIDQANIHFVLKHFAISYGNSATTWREMMEKTHLRAPTYQFMGIAPFFPKTGPLSMLSFNQLEVEGLLSIVKGDGYFGSEATREVVMENMSDYRILHFATHAFGLDQDPRHSWIALWGPEEVVTTNRKQYKGVSGIMQYELYSKDLSADLVVFSSCETGKGRLLKGEGMISLGHAFSYAGAKSQIATLWEVSDGIMPSFFQEFYTLLKQGYTKDKALQEAKISLVNTGRYRPFTWASIISFGDMRPLVLEDQGWWSRYLYGHWIALGLILVVLSIIWIVLHRRFRSPR